MVKQLTTVSEFDGWQAFFRERMHRRDKADYYAAAIVRAVYASQGAKVGDVSKYLLDFEVNKPETKSETDSKSIWLGIFGIDLEQNTDG